MRLVPIQPLNAQGPDVATTVTYIGNGEGHTLLVLTDAESRLIRDLLLGFPEQHAAFNRGIRRGTERMAAEFKQRAKK